MGPEKVKIVAYQLGEKIQLKNFKLAYRGEIHSSSLTDLLIKKGEHSYIYVQHFGEVAFANCTQVNINEFIGLIVPFLITPIPPGKEFKDDFEIQIDPNHQLNFHYTHLQVPELNSDVLKIIMLNVSQSVALDYYTELSLKLIHNTNTLTHELELRGKLGVSKKNLMKFIGKVLNTQSRIIDNLYFLDAPDLVWENQYLSKINTGLSKTFDLKTRFREVEYTLKIVDNNLRTFAQLIQHRDSNKLEWIIIFLILFETLHAIIGKYV